jgi:CoA-dependent NAD(P)H sulfur oxidoreductase
LLTWEDERLTQILLERLQRCQIGVNFNATVRSPDDVPCDLAVFTAGFTPNAAAPAEAGVELGRTRAIRVNDRQETNLAGLYAAGDCAEVNQLITGRPVWIPLGTTANKTGRVAGSNAAGKRARFDGVVGTSIVRVGGLAVGLTGLSESAARQEGFSPVSVRVDAPDKALYFRGRRVTVILVADRATGRLLGAAVLGDEGVVGRINTVAAALTAHMKADVFADLDLAYAPPYATVNDPLLVAARQLTKLLN